MGDPVPVRIIYRFLSGSDQEEFPLTLLSPEPTTLSSLRASLNGGGQALTLRPARDHYFQGSIPLTDGETQPEDTVSLEIDYTVDGAWQEGRATIPLVAPEWVPEQPTPRTFLSQVAVPEGLTVKASFPTSVLARPNSGTAGNYEIGLQGVPAMLLLRVVAGDGPIMTLERGLDLLVVAILGVMVLLGIRYLRGRKA
jgi:hypothetical protein